MTNETVNNTSRLDNFNNKILGGTAYHGDDIKFSCFGIWSIRFFLLTFFLFLEHLMRAAV